MDNQDKLIVVAGGGGFIGGHLIEYFKKQGATRIRCVDVKPMNDWYQVFDEVENVVANLEEKNACYDACGGASEVYNLAADMGGMGFLVTTGDHVDRQGHSRFPELVGSRAVRPDKFCTVAGISSGCACLVGPARHDRWPSWRGR